MNNPKILWQDEAEWYVVCYDCRDLNSDHAWSGSTRVANWEKHQRECYKYAQTVERCEFCHRPFDWFVNIQDAMFWLFAEPTEWPKIRGPFPDEVPIIGEESK